MKYISFIIILTVSIILNNLYCQEAFHLKSGRDINVSLDSREAPVVKSAYEILQRDIRSVLDLSLKSSDNYKICIGTIGINPKLDISESALDSLKNHKEAFLISVNPTGKLIIAGSDSHGTAYGIMELSRMLGVSPWEWWADSSPEKQSSFTIPANYYSLQYPSVEFRGIFINDEDWGLLPWSENNYDPGHEKGTIGPRTNERIFELLLRLRANTYWPAMHECTVPFFLTAKNKETAKRYGIYIGGSHCEPMASNAAGEWNRRGTGEYDYVNNREAVLKFWEDRVKEVANQEIIYTLGMRGVHDGRMQGASTIEAQKNVLIQAFADQRNLIRKYINKDISSIPQVFIPYKEILDVYNSGLRVPDDVTLMWCDDNYGYIRHFPTKEELNRSGGNGIYYHVSYWGRPHDYLWLGTFSPALLYQQMKTAYDKGIRKIWILNVGDIKPAEYQIELFMGMAWNINKITNQGVERHLNGFLSREFGQDAAEKLLPAMLEHYRLSFICKPEFLGNTRVEEKDRKYYSTLRDMPWSRTYIDNRLADCHRIARLADSLSITIPERQFDTYYHLVKYPLLAAEQMNIKHLKAQLARHGKASWEESDAAMDSIISLTRLYNKGYNNNGKWNGIMSYTPRNLPVFGYVPHQHSDTIPLNEDIPYIAKFSITDAEGKQKLPYTYLGYENKATALKPNEKTLFLLENHSCDSIVADIRILPTHPVAGNKLRLTVSLNDEPIDTLNFATKGRSEEWKQNVLRNQAIRYVTLPVKSGKNKLTMQPLDEGIVFDQIFIYDKNTFK